ncbi:M56 family metallopeptidase [Chitinophaga flava]|uniref:Peptidase M56 n=1 Tax=Chitinophaga flava TaxID=2259036 RepID=A0A365XS99_9BACT|nr:M56 family metallopeptidase [Chitinophaga flava]RBL88604.1 peptidase M56 [Chitinophaga flava]
MIPAILIYLLKANIALTLFFLAYWLGLRRLTFYTLNRVFLLTGIAFSSLFPLVAVNSFVNRHQAIAGGMTYLPDLEALKTHADTFTVWTLLVYLFWAGVTVMAIRFSIQLFSLWTIHRKSRPGVVEGTAVRTLQKELSPFSFFRHIYINPSLHQPEEIPAILCHEQVHVKQWHSADVILGELNNIFYWFNPGAWMMKTAIRENLEFITDRYLLKQGIDKKTYQYSLIQVSGIPYATAIANNFNFSHLKNRIIMMNRKQSSAIQVVRYGAFGVLVGGLVLSLNYSRASVVNHRVVFAPAAVQPKDSISSREAVFVAGPAAPERTASPKARPAVSVANPAPAPAAAPAPAPKEAAPAGVAAAGGPATVTLSRGNTASGDGPLYLLNGRLITDGEMRALNADDIESISVYKGASADAYVAQYGESARNGVVEIFTKSWAAANKKTMSGQAFIVKNTTISGTANRVPAATGVGGKVTLMGNAIMVNSTSASVQDAAGNILSADKIVLLSKGEQGSTNANKDDKDARQAKVESDAKP